MRSSRRRGSRRPLRLAPPLTHQPDLLALAGDSGPMLRESITLSRGSIRAPAPASSNSKLISKRTSMASHRTSKTSSTSLSSDPPAIESYTLGSLIVRTPCESERKRQEHIGNSAAKLDYENPILRQYISAEELPYILTRKHPKSRCEDCGCFVGARWGPTQGLVKHGLQIKEGAPSFAFQHKRPKYASVLAVPLSKGRRG
jgi:hypothetical protein